MSSQKKNDTYYEVSKGLSISIILFAALSFVVFTFALDAAQKESFVENERVKAQQFAEELQERLLLLVFDYEIRAAGLSTAFEYDDNIDQEKFSRLAGRFIKHDDSIINLAVIDGTRIELVHPLESNAHLVGRELKGVKAQADVFERIHKTGEFELQGPLELLQGGLGFILRMPVADTFGSQAQKASSDRFRSC